MNDPVSQELARRAAEKLPWRGALLLALALHLAALVTLLVAARPAHKALTLPTVRVHLGPLPSPAGSPTAAPATGPVPAARPTPPPPAKPAGVSATLGKAPAPSRKAVRADKKAAGPAAAKEKSQASTRDQPAASAPPAGGPTGDTLMAGSGRGLGVAAAPSDGPPFPYQYYLERLLVAIEQNWFKPQAPAGTRARVLCRIARSGRLLEAGLEETSGHGAFDRAALRAVYAAAPFPPLPQGFGGSELILHLEFVQ